MDDISRREFIKFALACGIAPSILYSNQAEAVWPVLMRLATSSGARKAIIRGFANLFKKKGTDAIRYTNSVTKYKNGSKLVSTTKLGISVGGITAVSSGLAEVIHGHGASTIWLPNVSQPVLISGQKQPNSEIQVIDFAYKISDIDTGKVEHISPRKTSTAKPGSAIRVPFSEDVKYVLEDLSYGAKYVEGIALEHDPFKKTQNKAKNVSFLTKQTVVIAKPDEIIV